MGPLLIADLLSTGVKAGEGIADLIRAGRLNKQAAAAVPPSTDPQEQEMTMLLNTIRKGRYTGASYNEANRQLDRNQNLVNNQIVQTGGGGGATMAALAEAQGQYGENYGKIFAGDEANKLAYTQMYNESMNRMVQRRAGLAMMKYAQLKTEATQAQQAGEENLNLLATTLPDFNFSGGTNKKTMPPPTANPRLYAKGGTPIRIKPSHVGKFTLWARRHGFDSVQAAASTVLQNKGKYPASVVEQANFAKSATKFVHEMGGTMKKPKPTKKPNALTPYEKAQMEMAGDSQSYAGSPDGSDFAASDFDQDMRLQREHMRNPHKYGGDMDEPESEDNPTEEAQESDEPILMFDKDSGEMIGTMDYGENIVSKSATRAGKRMARKGQHLQLGKLMAKEFASQPK